MGRRRKRRKVIPKRVVRIPALFTCPRCSSRALSIAIKKKSEYRAYAIVMCGSCGLLDDEDFQDVPATYQTVDVYAKFIDLFYNGQAKIKETKIGVEEREETS